MMTEGTARYAREGGNWFLKLGGDLRFTLGPALNALLDRVFADPEYRRFVIDLSEAEQIDSTCLGILARIGNRARETGGQRPLIVNAGEDLVELLKAVCFDRLFDLVGDTGGAEESESGLAQVPAGAPTDESAMRSLVLAAHRRLCEIDAHNRETFMDLIRMLEDEERRAREAPR